jgi:hypothetical protein
MHFVFITKKMANKKAQNEIQMMKLWNYLKGKTNVKVDV